jgi:hypothetical protein
VTETCDTAGSDSDGEGVTPPQLIVNVETTDATVPGNQMTEPIHAHLDQRGLLPGGHLVDSGYPSSGAAGVLPGLLRDHAGHPDAGPHLTAGPGGRGVRPRRVHHRLRRPARHLPARPYQQRVESGAPARHPTIVITFSKADCGPCPVCELCTTSASQRRQLTVHTRPVHQAQLAARAAAETKDVRARYALRAGVEGTIRQGVAVTGMRRARYRGLDKTRMEHAHAAVAST